MSDLDKAFSDWIPTIGLEIHAQLNTQSKLFSPEPNQFGDEPNVNIGFFDTGQPGALPVLNQKAIEKAVLFGLAVNATIHLESRFDRKSYFYPDCPANYQVTQFYKPILSGGSITVKLDSGAKTFTLDHTHLENDAGKLLHFNDFAGVDFNRSGAPLIEIVSTPCMSSPTEAAQYAQAIKAILEYTNVSDCSMQEGHLRMDANVSVRKKGETELRNKIEIKNMNSFTNMRLALEAEIVRQIHFYQENPDKTITSGTYRFDLESQKTILMRKKETADDYRYFPEPDLPPIVLTEAYVENIRSKLPELPQDRYDRYINELELSAYSASVLVNDKKLSDDFENGLQECKNPISLCNWLTVEFAGRIKESGKTVTEFGISVPHIAELVNLIEDKSITGKIAKKVADDMVQSPGTSPRDIVRKNPDYTPITDTSQIQNLVQKVLQENPESIEDYKSGKAKAFQFLIGQVMKACKGKASPELVRDLLQKEIT